ncbi:MAG: ATP-binding protein [Pseudomonadota bacterium]
MILITGPTGAGKTTHALAVAGERGAIRFSIDPWMQTLYAKDMTALDFDWMMERVERCYVQIWSVCEQILAVDGHVVLDLGFTTRRQRQRFVDLADAAGVTAELHYVTAPTDTRKQRVRQRNAEKDPRLYAFDVTDDMFAFMEPRYEPPSAEELVTGRTVVG